VYLLLFFNDLNNFLEPKLPFYPKTICWTQNKTFITSGLQKIVAILKLLILRKPVLLEYIKIVKIIPLFFRISCAFCGELLDKLTNFDFTFGC